MGIQENIDGTKAAQSLHAAIGELLAGEVPQLPSDRSRETFWELMFGSALKNLPEKPQELKQKKTRPPIHWTRTQEEAFVLVGEIEELADSIVFEGEEFAASVLEKSKSIGTSVEQAGWATDRQLEALENMLEGLRRWHHN